MEILLGLMIIYSWVHASMISFKKLNNLTDYEKTVMIAAFIFFVIFTITTIME